MKIAFLKSRVFAGMFALAVLGGGVAMTTGCETIGLAKGESDVAMEKIPERAREKILEETEGAQITELKKSQVLGRDRYRVQYEKNGKTRHFEVGESGKVLEQD